MKYNKEVFRNITLITQLGIQMMTPIFLCVAAGVFLDSRFSTYFTLPLLIIGILAGGRNTYILASSANRQAERKDRKEDGSSPICEEEEHEDK